MSVVLDIWKLCSVLEYMHYLKNRNAKDNGGIFPQIWKHRFLFYTNALKPSKKFFHNPKQYLWCFFEKWSFIMLNEAISCFLKNDISSANSTENVIFHFLPRKFVKTSIPNLTTHLMIYHKYCLQSSITNLWILEIAIYYM